MYQHGSTSVSEAVRSAAAAPDDRRASATAPPAEAGLRRPRIAMLAYAFYDTDNRIIRYAETLVRQGFEVDVFALRRDGQPRRELVGGVQVFRIQLRRRDERGKFGYLFRILRFVLGSSLAIGRHALVRRYALVHVHSVPDFEVFAAWLPKLLGARVILDIHDLVPELYAEKFGVARGSATFRLLLYLERRSAAFADHVIAANHLWWRTLCRRSVAVDKCTAIPNYVDRTVFTRPESPDETDEYRIVYAGGLQPHQGLDLAVRALAKVRMRYPRTRLHIYGEGVEKTRIAVLASELGLQDCVLLKDPVPYHSIPALLAGATIGVVPKRADGFANEAFSTKILECMSQAVPVVVARTAVDSYYYPESAVRFFDPGDETSLAEAMTELLDDPGARRCQALRGYRFAARNSWQVKQHVYLDLVKRLLSPPAGGRQAEAAAREIRQRQPASAVE